MPTAATQRFGSLSLPDPVQEHVNALCAELKITGVELFCKWEAWLLTNNKSDDVPTTADLDLIAASIREKTVEDKAPQTPTPHSSRRKSATPLFTPGPTPPSLNIDDFFSYIDDPSASATADLQSPPATEEGARTVVTKSSPKQDMRLESSQNVESSLTDADPLDASAKRGHSEFDTKLPGDEGLDEAYTRRAGSGRVEASHEGIAVLSALAYTGDGDVDMTSSKKSRAPVQVNVKVCDVLASDARYMNDELGIRVENLRARVKTLGASILRRVAATNGLDAPPVCSVEAFFTASPEPTWLFGRIVVELDGSEGVGAGRINDKSVLLESVDGNIVKLNLARLEEEKRPLFLNPGMVIVVYGVNTNGRSFDVHAIYDNSLRILDESSCKDETDDEESPFINIVTAAGPYTTITNLKYEPLDDLLRVVERNRPDLVILTGPFIDARHSLLSDGLAVPFDQVFESRVLARVAECAKRFRDDGHLCKFVIIPSLEDVNQPFVCPQPPAKKPSEFVSEAAEDIIMTTNPSLIEVLSKDGGYCTTIGATSLPTVADLSSDSICWSMDKFQAISSHIVKQCSFYPTFPPTVNVPLDSTLMHGLDIPSNSCSPSVDLVLAPARLKAFVKVAEAGTMVVNSGLLCRGSGGGTYAEIHFPLHKGNRVRATNFNEKHAEVKVVRL